MAGGRGVPSPQRAQLMKASSAREVATAAAGVMAGGMQQPSSVARAVLARLTVRLTLG